MSSSTTLTTPKRSIWDGAERPMKASYGKLMMWFFLVSDAFTFASLLIAYGVVRYMHPAYEGAYSEFTFATSSENFYWPIPEKVFNAFPGLHGVDVPLGFVGLMTFILILSSVTMVLAVEAGERKSQKEVEKWMLWTIVGGVTFLGCQAWEWSHFIHGTDEGVLRDGVRIFGANLHENQYGPQLFADFFFFITGFHGLHVTSGVILNIVIFYNVVMGTYEKRGTYEMIEKGGLYWHFVDLVWVFVFTFFYLV
ncbi:MULTISPECIES: cytochrome c oxidase subunit 3 [Flammeovirga]|uniref:Cytochrome oxidase subunit III n=1 Tax=Flammeovirga agarivorans TaxID=2726742 RepID=A0A7X8SLI1_9BACT|nr:MULTISPECIES: cytochrome c oxidase subunit 3 [Flammeovirga]NLR92332.1 cytochrome oxidase subunit III [Flammeovirga agarivorans]